MLVLSRRTNEKIVMPTLGATIQVVAAKHGVVRLGIIAPDDVPVFREEVLERLEPEVRARLVPAAAADQTDDQVRLVNAALKAAVQDLDRLRRQLELGRTENLAATLDELARDLRTAQDLTANPEESGMLLRNVAVATLKAKEGDAVEY